MSLAHGPHAVLGLLCTAPSVYIRDNKNKKRETPRESSGLIRGDVSMAYTSSALAPREMAFSKADAVRAVRKPSLFSRLIDALMVARTRAAEREIARYLRGNGGKFTDESEREIERRFLSNQTHW
jgi:hypothetical protein